MDSMDLRDTVNLMDRGGSGNLRDKESLMSGPLRPICPLKNCNEHLKRTTELKDHWKTKAGLYTNRCL